MRTVLMCREKTDEISEVRISEMPEKQTIFRRFTCGDGILTIPTKDFAAFEAGEPVTGLVTEKEVSHFVTVIRS